MTTTFKRILASVGLLAVLVVPVAFTAQPAFAGTIRENICSGATSAGIEDCEGGDAEGGLRTLVERIVFYFTLIVGAISVVMIILGGFRYITSSGDSSNVQAAKNTILYAIVGLAIVLLAQLIVNFVFTESTTISG